MSTIRRALISVSDKRGLLEFARGLHRAGVSILSTGGTAATLSADGIPVTSVSAYTNSPEILDGRVKTLHPKIHGGLLARPTPEHQAQLREHSIENIDLVVVNLYPFEATIARADATLAEAIENIDIGGPAMLRSSAKNHERVAVVVDPDDYPAVLADLAAGGSLTARRRFALACKAFAHTAAYDTAIATYLSGHAAVPVATGASEAPAGSHLPPTLRLQCEKLYDLRYGENPHQQAAFYASRDPGTRGPTVASADVLGGKQLSYNNILDLDAALGLCLEFDAPTAVVVKHNNPCGVASAEDVASAFEAARAADPVSAFGGIVALNCVVDDVAARLLVSTFLECVIAPDYTDEARRILAEKKNLRVCAAAGRWAPAGAAKSAAADAAGWGVRSVAGGVLVQTIDAGMVDVASARCATARSPSPDEMRDLAFAWRVAKHVKSNAIVFARDQRTVAIGAGQMSRVDSVRICEQKAGKALQGAVVASDAFFPFRDGLDVLATAGARAVIQPGGSVRDEEVIAAANEHGVAMLMTGMRHFRH